MKVFRKGITTVEAGLFVWKIISTAAEEEEIRASDGEGGAELQARGTEACCTPSS